jgi:FSR family fosmidomycin resistance protein-like MFS transporter
VLIVLGVAEYLPFSVQVTLGHDYLPRRIGTASGVTLGLGLTVGGAFTPLAGLVADQLGLSGALYLGVAALVVALPLALRLPEPAPARSALAPPATDRA